MSRINLLDYSALFTRMEGTALQPWRDTLPEMIDKNFNADRWGDIPRWLSCIEKLPLIETRNIHLDMDTVSVAAKNLLSEDTQKLLESALRGLHPWRKGPFDICGTYIDTEWRSDWKWQRLQKHVAPLTGKTVLDVGCGSGYHCWRIKGAGADLVIGIDPSPLFVVQYWALQHFLQNDSVFVVPAACEDLPQDMQAFDTVFSMGVLYHRRSPMDHLLELKQLLKPGGQLVLETLVIAGNENTVLVPDGRYGRMGNVWFIPSVAALTRWLEKMRFSDIKLVDVCTTTTDEQRSTNWMTFQSLQDFLDPDDSSKTIEGYPAPMRAVLTATR
ncbi:MAG TPA: tRNA 5-methoxyuridine(34)/uridine 5-oxyacetic acid(34) synthase CmoB [Pseudomonadales bacterium]|nr:tRNA 5-methoxyuridine(34)/uridine 5-oxyacetic acid(34) synthase CmoB [Pseudomonadales bacterium]